MEVCIIKSIYRRYRKLVVVSFIMATLVALSVLPYPLVLKYFVDNVIPAQKMNDIVLWSIMLLVVVLIRIVCNFFQNYSLSIVEGRFERDLKVSMFEKVIKMPMSFFVKNDTGSIMSRITNDSSNSVGLYRDYYVPLYSSILGLTAACAVMLYMDWFLTLISFILLPVLMVVSSVMNGKMAKESMKMSESYQGVSKEISDGINAIETVKIDNLYNTVLNRFKTAANKLMKVNVNINKYGAWAGGFMTGIVSLAPILVFIVGTFRVIDGNTTIGAVISISNLILLLFTPINEIAMAGIKMQKPKALWKKIDELMQMKEERLDKGTMNGYDLKLEDVDFAYDNRDNIFNGINISIPEGDFVSIVGKTGSGKSTLYKILAKFYDCAKGKYTVGGKSGDKISTANLRDRIAYINRNTYIFNGTLRENISLGKQIEMRELQEAMKIACLDETFNLDSETGDQGKGISDGQRVRIAIARAVIKKPDIFMIDEALTALDPVTEGKVLQNLKNKFPKSSFLVITHRDTVFDHSDKICILENEKFSKGYSKEEIKKIDGFREIFSEV